MQDLALYIHWPFCLSKCPYCDFNSHVRDAIDEVGCAGGEASMIMLGNAVFSTVPFTGSTTTTLSKRAVELLP